VTAKAQHQRAGKPNEDVNKAGKIEEETRRRERHDGDGLE